MAHRATTATGGVTTAPHEDNGLPPWGHPPARRSSSCRAVGSARRAAAAPRRHRALPAAPAVVRTWGRGDVVGGRGTRRGPRVGQGGAVPGAVRTGARHVAQQQQHGVGACGQRVSAVWPWPWEPPGGRGGDSGVTRRAWENSRQRLRQSQREGVRFPPITAQLAWLPPITARQTPASHQSWREGQGSYQSQQRGRKVPPIAAEHAPASDQSQPNTPPSHQSQQMGHSSHQSLGGGTAATNHSTAHLPPTNQSRGAGVSHQSQRGTHLPPTNPSTAHLPPTNDTGTGLPAVTSRMPPTPHGVQYLRGPRGGPAGHTGVLLARPCSAPRCHPTSAGSPAGTPRPGSPVGSTQHRALDVAHSMARGAQCK